eukprot:TRINITY_DN1501_c0_g2_i1.p1 TRINITY_DN1501_c0_g2~~TRINITY_DN1501_c0_g2_i1.p1  ORF type:complete len:121 (-),score=12.90 TRINITY_DN1501_c0_g2_i1:832-1194(-)
MGNRYPIRSSFVRGASQPNRSPWFAKCEKMKKMPSLSSFFCVFQRGEFSNRVWGFLNFLKNEKKEKKRKKRRRKKDMLQGGVNSRDRERVDRTLVCMNECVSLSDVKSVAEEIRCCVVRC